MREGNREYFYEALDRKFPAKPGEFSLKQKYIKTYGYNYYVPNPREHELMIYLKELCRRNNIMLGTDKIFKWIEEFPQTDRMQPGLFD